MNRRNFLGLTALSTGCLSLGTLPLKASQQLINLNGKINPGLAKHKIVKGEIVELNYHWPRFVGKNGRIDFHGQDHKCTALKLYTDKGAMGWGLSDKRAEEMLPTLLNKQVSELIIPGQGITGNLNRSFDFALHDLAGIILNKPVYELLGSNGNMETSVYSGMIYLDELTPENKSKGLDVILENCEWDYNYGYRMLKVKIGRSGRWYPHQEGLQKDIEIVNLIYDSFKEKGVGLLVDSNDMYSLEDTITFLEGLNDVLLFWVEEPFNEEIEKGKKLRNWMDSNGYKETLYADGEYDPNFDVCLQMGKENILDVFLPDVYGHGFTEWIKLMDKLKGINMLASPHAWGNMLKTHYIAHLSAGLGNIVTIEGVTCISDEIDYGDYKIIDGNIRVSDAPGFGMKLLV